MLFALNLWSQLKIHRESVEAGNSILSLFRTVKWKYDHVNYLLSPLEPEVLESMFNSSLQNFFFFLNRAILGEKFY